jgi:hypothetical protein
MTCTIGGKGLENQDYSGNRQKAKCNMVPEVFYPAAEADKLLEMIRPVLGEARQMVAKNPGEFPIFEWFLRSFQLCYQEPAVPGL